MRRSRSALNRVIQIDKQREQAWETYIACSEEDARLMDEWMALLDAQQEVS